MYYIYFLTNKNRTTLYIGVTNNLQKRVNDHKIGRGSIFTKKYNLEFLIYYETFESPYNAIAREKQLKNWHKDWKWNLVKNFNPDLEEIIPNFLE